MGVIKELSLELGEEKAFEIARNFHEKKWLAEFEEILSKNKRTTNILSDALRLVYIDYLKLMPYEFKVEKKNENEILIRCFNECQILGACTASNLETAKICCGVFNQPMQALLSRLDQNLRYERHAQSIRPQQKYCEEKIFLEK